MKIGIDARLFDESGNGRYIRNLLSHLQEIDNKNQYYIFLLKKTFDKVDFNDNFKKVLADISWYGIKEQTKFLKLLYQNNLDLVHFPHFNVPIFYNKKFIVTLHDLIHQHFSMQRASTHGRFIYSLKTWGYNLAFKHAISKSEKIITVSNFVKDQLISEWSVDSKKVKVIYEACEDAVIEKSAQTTESRINQVLTEFKIKRPFIFYIGNAHPHKNIETLIESFLKLRSSFPQLALVLAGKDHYFWQKIRNKYTHEDIKYLGFIIDEQLVALYKGAVSFILPSFEEGFGIPLLEAFACRCPVISSDIGALREIGRDACLYFNPKNINDLVACINKILRDAKFRKELIEKGTQRYKQFSWRNLAEKTLEVYNSSLT